MKERIKNSEAPQFDAEGYQTNIKDLNGESLPDLDKLEFRPFSHGGARKGAGRKSTGRKPVLLRLSHATIKRLHARAKAESKTISEVAEERLTVM
jgi:hypothetical protein